ncbi:hypothetical protein EDD22DRAFT_959064 [Suillus occidentalis]|nr:hypothetical protein EDD22DRAFT_959064 [Suillus occidentalis]
MPRTQHCSGLPINGIFASLRRQSNRSLSELQPAPANHCDRDQPPLHATNPWPGLHEDSSRPVPNPYVDSFYPEALPSIQSDQTFPPATSSHHNPVPDPPPGSPKANWVQDFFDLLASDPQASHQEAGPSGSSQNPNCDSDILPNFPFNDEMAYMSLSTPRVPSRPVQHNKPYDRNHSSMSARTRIQNQEEGNFDIVKAMHCVIFNGAFMPEPPDPVNPQILVMTYPR